MERNLDAIQRSLKPGGTFYVDVPSPVLFTSRSFESRGLIESAVLESEGANVYRYRESVTVTKRGRTQRYEDDFLIRYWEPALFLERAASHDFVFEEELDGFAGTGSNYFCLTRN